MLADSMGPARGSLPSGLHKYFFHSYGVVAPQVKGALERTGLTDRARIFTEAMTLCGTPYPTDRRVRLKRFAGAGIGGRRLEDLIVPPTDANLFDRRMLELGAAFGSGDALWMAIEDVVAKSPSLEAWVREERDKLSDYDRLRHLTSGLVIDAKANEAAILAAWPRPYRTLFLLNVLYGEVRNGGVHQFFYDASGDLAPQVVVALRDVGLEKQAAAIERGIAQFKAPYPVDTQTRRRLYFNEIMDRPFDQALHDLTDGVDDAAVQAAMIDLAKRENILPH